MVLVLITDGRANVPLDVSYNPKTGTALQHRSLTQQEKLGIRETNKDEVRPKFQIYI